MKKRKPKKKKGKSNKHKTGKPTKKWSWIQLLHIRTSRNHEPFAYIDAFDWGNLETTVKKYLLFSSLELTDEKFVEEHVFSFQQSPLPCYLYPYFLIGVNILASVYFMTVFWMLDSRSYWLLFKGICFAKLYFILDCFFNGYDINIIEE